MLDFVTVDAPVVTDFVRNGRGQPMVTPADGGKPVPYNRPSSWGKRLEDMYGISQWEKRCVVVGMSRTPSLMARAAAIVADPKAWSKADKDALNLIADEAKTAARSNEAADIGTAVHRMTERIDLGENLSDLPEPFASDMAAYIGGMTVNRLVTSPEWVEVRMVNDELKLAGTADRLVTIDDDPVPFVFDLKTGQSIELAALGYAVQLAIYAHSYVYDVPTGTRHDTICHQDKAFIGHLPAGQASFSLFEVDISAGWQAALLAADIDTWRKRRGLVMLVPDLTPITSGLAERRAHLKKRCRVVAELDANAAAVMASTWPPVPTLASNDLTDADLDVIEAHLAQFETTVSAPFAEPLPTTADPQPQRVVEVAPVALPDAVPDEGPLVADDDPQFVAMKARYTRLRDDGHAWMAKVIGESIAACRSIHMSSVRSRRRVFIAQGLTMLAQAGLCEAARGIVYTILENDTVLDMRHPLGAVVSLLDDKQAAQFVIFADELSATSDLVAS